MNQVKRFAATLCVAAFLFASCNNAEKKDNPADSAAHAPDTSATGTPADKVTDVMLIMHKVASFSKWLPAYEAHDSARQAAGLHNFVIGRGLEDSNMVLVALRMDDITKAKSFSADPRLKKVMQDAGVSGMPDIKYIHHHIFNTSTDTNRVIITHKVKNWNTWKQVFDSHEQARKDAGLTLRGTGFSDGDSTMVTVVFNITDMQKAMAFMKSADLQNKMKEAGVEGKPKVFAYRVVKQY